MNTPGSRYGGDLHLGTLLLALLAWRTGWTAYVGRWRYAAHRPVPRHSPEYGRKRGGPRHVRRTSLLVQLGIRSPQELLVDAAISVVGRVDATTKVA